MTVRENHESAKDLSDQRKRELRAEMEQMEPALRELTP
jgi:hypothetical protein